MSSLVAARPCLQVRRLAHTSLREQVERGYTASDVAVYSLARRIGRLRQIAFAMDVALKILGNGDLSDEETQFIVDWENTFFGSESAGEDLSRAAVHWRILAHCGESLVGHAALSDLRVSVNDAFPVTMAIGGLFTHSEFQGQGIGNRIMEAAERFVFEDRGAELILLFCLASLREFYIRRGWQVITAPVLLEQAAGWIVWRETTMGLSRTGLTIADASVRVRLTPLSSQAVIVLDR